MTGPARGYKWADFTDGNTAALRHGADSPRTVEPVAAELRDWLADVAPWTQGPSFAPTIAAWAWAEARVQLVRRWLGDQPLVDDSGEVVKAATYLERLEGRAATLRAELGLTPQAMVKLLSALSSIRAPEAQQGLEALAAAGAALRRAAEERALETGTEPTPAPGEQGVNRPVGEPVDDQDDEEDGEGGHHLRAQGVPS